MKNISFLLMGAVVTFATLALPTRSGALTGSAPDRLPLELPFLLLGMIALGRRSWVKWAVVEELVLVALLKLADFGMFSAYTFRMDLIAAFSEPTQFVGTRP